MQKLLIIFSSSSSFVSCQYLFFFSQLNLNHLNSNKRDPLKKTIVCFACRFFSHELAQPIKGVFVISVNKTFFNDISSTIHTINLLRALDLRLSPRINVELCEISIGFLFQPPIDNYQSRHYRAERTPRTVLRFAWRFITHQ